MYRIVIQTCLACLLVSASAARTLELIEGAYEAVLADVAIPTNIAGNLVVRLCADCEPHVLRIDADTTYIGSTGPMSLDEFQIDVAAIRGTADGNRLTAVGVFFDMETNLVTRVSLHLR